VVQERPLVLVVEDEQPIREIIADVLRDRFRIVLATNGAEALHLLDSVQPYVVVLDLLMPVMHGWDFMENYSAKTAGRAIPIVVLSVNPVLPRSFDRLGVQHVVAKPFNVDLLLEAVERAVETGKVQLSVRCGET
jgi:CheY-like chemotaxis protein